MILEIGIIAAGVPFGFFLRKKEKFKTVVGHLCTYSVYALLFFLGLEIGSNEEIMQQIEFIGFKALILSLTITGASLIAGIYVHKRLKGLK